VWRQGNKEKRGERPPGESGLGSGVTDREVLWGNPKRERMEAWKKRQEE